MNQKKIADRNRIFPPLNIINLLWQRIRKEHPLIIYLS